MRLPKAAWAALLAGGVLWGAGLGWNLPGEERAALVLPKAERTPERVAELLAARQAARGEFINREASAAKRAEGGGETEIERRAKLRWMDAHETARVIGHYLILSGHGDEHRTLIALSNMRPKRLDFNPHSFLYGGPYVYSVAAFQAVAGALGYVPLSGGLARGYADPGGMGRIFRVGRLHQWACTLLLCLAVFFTVRALYDERTAALALALAATAPAVVHHAHAMKPHQLMAAFWVLSLWASWRLANAARPGWKDYLWPALLAGFSTGTNILGQTAFFTYVIAAFWRKGPQTDVKDPKPWGAAAAGVAAFFIVNPYVLVSWTEFRYEVLVSTGKQFWFLVDPVALLNGWWVLLGSGLGVPMLLAASGAPLVLWRKGSDADRFLIFALAVGFVWTTTMMGRGPADVPQQSRYLFPQIALAGALAVRALARLPGEWSRGAFWGLLVWNLATGLTYAATFMMEARPATSNVAAASRWIAANVPEDQPIAYWASDLRPGLPAVRFDRRRVALLANWTLEEALAAPPAWLIVGQNMADALNTPRFAAWKKLLPRYERRALFHRPLPGGALYVDRIGFVNMPFEIYRLRTPEDPK